MNLVEYSSHLVHKLNDLHPDCDRTTSHVLYSAIERILATETNDDLIELLVKFVEAEYPNLSRVDVWDRTVWFVSYQIAIGLVEVNTVKDWAHLIRGGLGKIRHEDIADYVRENFLTIGKQVTEFYRSNDGTF